MSCENCKDCVSQESFNQLKQVVRDLVKDLMTLSSSHNNMYYGQDYDGYDSLIKDEPFLESTYYNLSNEWLFPEDIEQNG